MSAESIVILVGFVVLSVACILIPSMIMSRRDRDR